MASHAGAPQNIINKSYLEKMDIVLALFKYRLGTPILDPITNIEQAPSGTVAELLYAIGKNKDNIKPLAMLYIYEIDPSEINNEWKRLQVFKNSIS